MEIKDLRFDYRMAFRDINASTVFVMKDNVYMKLKKNDWLVDAVELKTGRLIFIPPHEACTPIPNAELMLMDFKKQNYGQEESEGE